jgi:hypothetical protein
VGRLRPLLILVLVAGMLTSSAFAAAPTVNLSLTGSIAGKPVSGKVQFGRLICAPLTGKGLQLLWNGDLKVGGADKQASGEMQFSTTGKSTFGAHGTATASLVVGGSYASRLGSTSGTATVAANRKSGTISVRLALGSSKVQEAGSWTCG